MADYSDAALVLAGHGSTLNAEAAAPICQQGDELRRRKLFAQVQETFWKQEPYLAQVMRGVYARRVFVVPLFISEGYFTQEVVPRELGFCQKGQTHFSPVQHRGGQMVAYCPPVGIHRAMTNVVLARALEVVERFPFPQAPAPAQTALFLAGHGTGSNENSRKAIESQVEWLRQRRLYAEVHAIFMEEEPRIADCYELTACKSLVVVPFFISDGLHSYQDIPLLLGAAEGEVRRRLKLGQPAWRNPSERHGKRVWYGSSVGSDPAIAEVILEIVAEQNLR
jgi:sirohydrochlorin cobaltochelatase